MRYLVFVAALATVTPSAAHACAMPRMDERELAKLMVEIDEAAVAPVAPVAQPAPAVVAPAPAVTPVVPAAMAPAPTAPSRAKSPPPTSMIPEVSASPDV